MEGDTVLIGAYKEASNGKDSGAAYLLSITGDSLQQELRIVPETIEKFDHFGESLGVVTLASKYMFIGLHIHKQSLTLIGAHKKETTHGLESGVVYMYSMENSQYGTLIEIGQLLPNVGSPYMWFGRTIGLEICW